MTNIINILNRFGIIFENANFINRICLKPLCTNNTLSHLFYTNTKTTTHNKRIFEKTIGETFRFVAKICILTFVLLIMNYQCSQFKQVAFIMNYSSKNHLNKIMGWKLRNIKRSCKWCRWQLSLLYSSICSKPLIWINFYNPKIGINMKIQHPQTYKDFPTFKKNWTTIEQKIVEIPIGNNLFILL